MPRRNEQAVDMWVKLRERGYSELISREKTATLMGVSECSVRKYIAHGDLKVDKITNKVKLHSIAEFLCG